MSDDLVKRLRVNDAEIYLPILGQAADRIEELASMEECLTAELGDANDRIEELERHLTLSGKVSKALSERIEALEAEVERLQRSAEYWEQDAKRYAANQEHWRMEERAAIVAWLRGDRIVLSMDGSKEDVVASAIEAGEHLK